jgi:hypothetical protein
MGAAALWEVRIHCIYNAETIAHTLKSADLTFNGGEEYWNEKSGK